MTLLRADRYHRSVHVPRPGALRTRFAIAFAFLGVFLQPHAAGAETTSYEVGDKAVVQIFGRAAIVTVRTWNRNTVQLDWPEGGPFVPSKGVARTGSSIPIPTRQVKETASSSGPVMATLPPEEFMIPQMPIGMHDVVRVTESPASGSAPPGGPQDFSQLTVTIPASTGLLTINLPRGLLTLSDYRGTTVVNGGAARIVFDNVGGDAFVQPLYGHFYALNSNFDRLRVRSNRADQVYDNCQVKQIEATSLTGPILFDNGTFDTGLARFASDRGTIGIGVSGGAQLGAHTQDGRIFSFLPGQAQRMPGGGSGDQTQVAGNGGPLVNASSAHGSVFLYSGSIADRRSAILPDGWRGLYEMLYTKRLAAQKNTALLRPPPLLRPLDNPRPRLERRTP